MCVKNVLGASATGREVHPAAEYCPIYSVAGVQSSRVPSQFARSQFMKMPTDGAISSILFAVRLARRRPLPDVLHPGEEDECRLWAHLERQELAQLRTIGTRYTWVSLTGNWCRNVLIWAATRGHPDARAKRGDSRGEWRVESCCHMNATSGVQATIRAASSPASQRPVAVRSPTDRGVQLRCQIEVRPALGGARGRPARSDGRFRSPARTASPPPSELRAQGSWGTSAHRSARAACPWSRRPAGTRGTPRRTSTALSAPRLPSVHAPPTACTRRSAGARTRPRRTEARALR